jgi:hypothetical protein
MGYCLLYHMSSLNVLESQIASCELVSACHRSLAYWFGKYLLAWLFSCWFGVQRMLLGDP